MVLKLMCVLFAVRQLWVKDDHLMDDGGSDDHDHPFHSPAAMAAMDQSPPPPPTTMAAAAAAATAHRFHPWALDDREASVSPPPSSPPPSLISQHLTGGLVNLPVSTSDIVTNSISPALAQ